MGDSLTLESPSSFPSDSLFLRPLGGDSVLVACGPQVSVCLVLSWLGVVAWAITTRRVLVSPSEPTMQGIVSCFLQAKRLKTLKNEKFYESLSQPLCHAAMLFSLQSLLMSGPQSILIPRREPFARLLFLFGISPPPCAIPGKSLPPQTSWDFNTQLGRRNATFRGWRVEPDCTVTRQ